MREGIPDRLVAPWLQTFPFGRMTMTRIGTSDLDVFPLVFGGNVFGWTADRDRSFELLDAFHAGGGNLIDTADGYSH
jgi:aryl-alcohol dehydrogenase-like predicted oxidoreductase